MSNKITYKRVLYPVSILGVQPDYLIMRDGEEIGYVKVDRAGRSSGTRTRWTAHVSGGKPLSCSYSTFAALKENVIKPYFWRHSLPTGEKVSS